MLQLVYGCASRSVAFFPEPNHIARSMAAVLVFSSYQETAKAWPRPCSALKLVDRPVSPPREVCSSSASSAVLRLYMLPWLLPVYTVSMFFYLYRLMNSYLVRSLHVPWPWHPLQLSLPDSLRPASRPAHWYKLCSIVLVLGPCVHHGRIE